MEVLIWKCQYQSQVPSVKCPTWCRSVVVWRCAVSQAKKGEVEEKEREKKEIGG